MEERTTHGSDALERRIYVTSLAIAAPLVPVIGWTRVGVEPFAGPVYAALTLGVVGTLVGLLTHRLSSARAATLLVSGVAGVVLLRLGATTYGAATSEAELRRIVTETMGPTLIACVLIIYLAVEVRPAFHAAVALWATFTLIVLPRVIAGWDGSAGVSVALLRQAMTLGAVVGLSHGLASLKTQLTEERVRARALDELASTDPLTGVSNRRGAEQALRHQLARVERYGGQLSVALFDLDRFKERNDHHGHAAGDEALVAVVSALRGRLRAVDVIGRWGGDELLVICPEASPKDACRSADRWRELIADLGLAAGSDRVTTSIGLASYQPGDDVDTILTRADRALYAAKRLGGDVVVTDEGQPAPDIVPAQDGTPSG